MKIAFINIYQGAVERGAEIYVAEISKRLSDKHETSVLSYSKSPGNRWPIVWRTYLDPFGLQTFWYTLGLLPKLLKEKYEVVIPVNGGWQPALVRLVTWIYGGKMVISGQSGIGWDDRNNLWCFPDYFIALTDYVRKWAKRANPFVKIKVIPNGVDIEKFFAGEKKIKMDMERPVILCVAALTKSKRLELAIKAVSKLKKGSLLLVGRGEEEIELSKLGKKLLGNRFRITSFPHEDMPKVYRSADLFTFPTSPNESFGIVMLEALASGLPVVANDDPIRREIVGDAGIFVDPTDAEKYGDKLKEVLSKKWGEKPIEQAKRFDWDEITKRYEIIFKDIVR